jgi:hypothetical protein
MQTSTKTNPASASHFDREQSLNTVVQSLLKLSELKERNISQLAGPGLSADTMHAHFDDPSWENSLVALIQNIESHVVSLTELNQSLRQENINLEVTVQSVQRENEKIKNQVKDFRDTLADQVELDSQLSLLQSEFQKMRTANEDLVRLNRQLDHMDKARAAKLSVLKEELEDGQRMILFYERRETDYIAKEKSLLKELETLKIENARLKQH